MKVTLKEMHLENYKCFTEKDICFAEKTEISGRNRAGKTTVMDAYFDIMTGKLSTGADASSDEIRTHDTNGETVDKVDVVRSITLDLDGREVEIKKIDRQNWVRPRGTTTEVFKGNKTSYEVDGIPMATSRQFSEWMEANIAGAENMLLASNPQYFLSKLNKSSVEARKIIESVSGFNVSDYSEQFADAIRILGGHTAEDVLKKLRKQLSEQKDKQEKKNTEIAYETNRQTTKDETLPEAKKQAEEKLHVIERKLEEINHTAIDYDIVQAEISGIKQEIFKLNEAAQADYRNQIEQAQGTKRKLGMELRERHIKAENIENDIRDCHNTEKAVRDRLTVLGERWKTISAEEYSGNTTCPMCGQPLPASEVSHNREEFDRKKAENLKAIEEEGGALKRRFTALFGKTGEYQEQLDSLNGEIKEISGLIEDVSKQLDQLLAQEPPKAKVDDLEAQIAEKEARLEELSSYSEMKRNLNHELLEAQRVVMNINAMLSAEEREEKGKKSRLAMLNEELREIGQKAAEIERDIQTLMDYSIEKNKIIAEKVNSHFRHFKFQFLEFTQEGNPVEVCKLMVDGTSYNGLLNGGDKRLSDIDLCHGFQEMLGLNLPIWMDEAGTVDAWRIPEMEQQLILIRYSESEGLEVK